MMGSDFLTLKEVAKVFNVSTPTVRRYCADGLLKFIKLPSGFIRIYAESVEELKRKVAVMAQEWAEGQRQKYNRRVGK